MPDGRAIRPSPRIDRAHCPPHMRRRPFGCPDAVSLKRPSKALYIAVRYKIAWVCRFCLWSQVIYGCKVPQLDPGSLCLQPMLARPLRAEAGDRIQSAYSASRNGWTHRMTDCARGPSARWLLTTEIRAYGQGDCPPKLLAQASKDRLTAKDEDHISRFPLLQRRGQR